MFDESKPTGTIGGNWTEVHFDGEPDSLVPEIGSHWHEQSDEHLQVLKGRVAFKVDGKDVILQPGDDELVVPRYVVHSFKFFKGEPTILREHTTPVGVFKQEFFEDLLSTGTFSELSFFQVMRVFGDGDTFLALPGNIKMVDKMFTWTLVGISRWFAKPKTVKVDSNGRLIQTSTSD